MSAPVKARDVEKRNLAEVVDVPSLGHRLHNVNVGENGKRVECGGASSVSAAELLAVSVLCSCAETSERGEARAAVSPVSGRSVVRHLPKHCLAAALAVPADPIRPAPAPGPLLDVQGMADLLLVSAKAVYGLYERGRLPRSIGPGRKLLWDRGQMLEFLRSRASSSARRSRR